MIYSSFRRKILDQLLLDNQYLMHGCVIDIGGKKKNKRGEFRPPLNQVASWEYANIDDSTKPDYCCSAESIPVDDGRFDVVLLCEVLEHVENPTKVLVEVRRVLKKGGTVMISVPFLSPLHADPYDFQRWSDTKLRSVLEDVGFKKIDITPMGGLWSVIHDLLYVGISRSENKLFKILFFRLLILVGVIFMVLDRLSSSLRNYVTTGYFVKAT